MPYTPEYDAILAELFEKNGIGEGTRIMPGLVVVRPGCVRIGKHCSIMNGCLMMGAGDITVDGDKARLGDPQLLLFVFGFIPEGFHSFWTQSY